MPLTPGTILENRYRIDALLGAGGMGAVYRAWDMRLDQVVAIKENALTTAASARQFEHEAKMMAGLRHPNLPRVSDHFVLPDGAQYLVMEYIAGEDLGTLLARFGPLDEARALAWLGQVCDALAYLHTQNPPIIHRDIKPANIKITPEGKVFLVDFGVAKVGGAQTQTGAVAVTPGFSPPEQYGWGGTDARSDVYALGATLYALLTGQSPPEGVQRAIQAAQLIPPRMLRPDLSPAVAAAIEAALCTTPTARPQSIVEFRARLRGTAPPSAPAAPPPPHPPTTHSPTEILPTGARDTGPRITHDTGPRITHDTGPRSAGNVAASAPPPAAPAISMPTGASVAAPPARRGIPFWAWLLGGVGLVLLGCVGLVILGAVLSGDVSSRVTPTVETAGNQVIATTAPTRTPKPPTPVPTPTRKPTAIPTSTPLSDTGATLEIVIENASPDEICYLQISLETSESWGEDMLAADEVIKPGEFKTVTVAEGVYDVMARDCSQAPMFSAAKVDSDMWFTVGVPGDDAVLVLDNQSSTDIWYVLISPSSADTWGADYLGGVEIIAVGKQRRFYVEPGTYDLLVAGQDEQVLVQEKGIELESGETPWKITD